METEGSQVVQSLDSTLGCLPPQLDSCLGPTEPTPSPANVLSDAREGAGVLGPRVLRGEDNGH